MSYSNENRGSIWKNDEKIKDTHPDFKGSAQIGQTEYWVSGWLRKPDANPKAPSLSFSFTPKEVQNTAPAPAASNDFDTDGDIPF